jgi:hypothetical protein
VQKPLAAADWNRLEDALVAADFWSLDRDDVRQGFDGVRWTIVGRRNGSSHDVHRWSPCGRIHDLGELFIELAGSKEIEDYFRVVPF